MAANDVDSKNQTQASARRELYEVYADASVKPRHKKKLIESLSEIYGYDLAFLVGLIMRSEFSGNLNIISQSNEISGISFSSGKITKIDLDDKENFIGELLIKDGFLNREKLLDLLADQSKTLTELLIQNKIATSEEIIHILIKQMRLRLSQYINNHKYQVNFSESDNPDRGLSISYRDYLGLAHDWVAGRFSADWLKLHYMELNEELVEVPNDIDVDAMIQNLPLSIDLAKMFKVSQEQQAFSKIFSAVKSEKDQEYFLKCFHYGIMSGQLVLKPNPNAAANADSVLKNIYIACSKKTDVELLETLAHILKFKPTEIDAIFQTINNYVHTYTGDDFEMKNNMFRIVLQMLSKKQFYVDAINKKYASTREPQDLVGLNKKITEIYNELLAKNLFVAVDRLKKINEHSGQIPKIKLYAVWAKALMILQNNIRINLADLDRDFLQILPEDKDTAEYFYVRSILAFLKKDETSAIAYYQKSIKLSPELKNYPPFKQESFIKKLFKFSVVVLLLCQTTKSFAQSAVASAEESSSVATAKEDPSTTEPKNKVPFVYLNQYFTYKVVSSNTLQINDKNYNLNDMIVTQTEKGFQVQLKDSLENLSNDPQFFFKSRTDKKTIAANHILEQGKFILSNVEPNTSDLNYICLSKKNQYSQISICKVLSNFAPSKANFLTVNNQMVPLEGTIILNDTNSKNMSLNLTGHNGDFINIETTKRLILPVKLEKAADSENFNIQFIDSGNSRSAWEDKININQNYFPLKFDELITLNQGIYFNNSITLETGLSQTFIDKDKLQRKYYNKLFVEPIIVYSELAGKSTTTDAVLRSSMGYGLSISIDRYLESGNNIFGSFSYYSTQLSFDTTTAKIKDPELSLMALSGGYHYTISDKWGFSSVIRLQEDMFFNQVNLTTVALTKSLIKMLGVVPEYTIYNQGKFVVAASAGGYLLLPTEVQNSTTTSMGTLMELEAKASYKTDWGRITGGMTYGNRSQKNDTYTYNGADLKYRFGLVYLF